ncbi:MAG: hypothetical protein [Microviridae sp.]|nr:MAG: hypothetical protein [Microviridae sp.]
MRRKLSRKRYWLANERPLRTQAAASRQGPTWADSPLEQQTRQANRVRRSLRQGNQSEQNKRLQQRIALRNLKKGVLEKAHLHQRHTSLQQLPRVQPVAKELDSCRVKSVRRRAIFAYGVAKKSRMPRTNGRGCK